MDKKLYPRIEINPAHCKIYREYHDKKGQRHIQDGPYVVRRKIRSEDKKRLFGVVEDHSPSGGYWISVEGHEGCYPFKTDQLEINVTKNILEIVVEQITSLPANVEDILDKNGAELLKIFAAKHFRVYQYDIKRKLWKELDDALAENKAVRDDIIDYEVEYHG